MKPIDVFEWVAVGFFAGCSVLFLAAVFMSLWDGWRHF